MFSALTGLRHCDIQKLKWSEVQKINDTYRLNFTQKKTKGVEYMPMSEQAYKLCGERKDPNLLVFAGLPAPSWISKPLKRWIVAAGITRKITFHKIQTYLRYAPVGTWYRHLYRKQDVGTYQREDDTNICESD